jgi:hypothetical protein
VCSAKAYLEREGADPGKISRRFEPFSCQHDVCARQKEWGQKMKTGATLLLALPQPGRRVERP